MKKSGNPTLHRVYHKNGTKLCSGHFKDDRQCGEWTTYDQPFRMTLIKRMAKRATA